MKYIAQGGRKVYLKDVPFFSTPEGVALSGRLDELDRQQDTDRINDLINKWLTDNPEYRDVLERVARATPIAPKPDTTQGSLWTVYFYPPKDDGTQGGYDLFGVAPDPHKPGRKPDINYRVREIAIGHAFDQALEKNKMARWSAKLQKGIEVELCTRFSLSDRQLWKHTALYRKWKKEGRIYGDPGWFLK